MRYSKSIFRQNYEDGIEGIMEIFEVNENTGYVYEEKVYYQTNIKKKYYDSKIYGQRDAKYYRDLQEELIEQRKEFSEKTIKNCNLINRLAKEQKMSYGEYVAKMYLEEQKKAELEDAYDDLLEDIKELRKKLRKN